VTYVGRLTEGKGSETLVAAWRRLPSVRLKIVGDGAFRSGLEAIAKREALNIEFVGMQPKNVVLDAMANAEFLVMPSECYEAFGMVIAESFACGTPVLASNIGSMGELVEDGVTGRKFTAGDPASLAHGVEAMLADKARLRDMRANARSYFDAHLTEDQNSSQLLQIYQDVLASAGR
jgi:glycosyltransferase involved in cell wall biosynthesis